MTKKAVIVYDDVLTQIKSGTKNRVINILEHLNKLDISIDQLFYSADYIEVGNSGSFIKKIINIKRQNVFFLRKILLKLRSKNSNLNKVGLKIWKQPLILECIKNQINVNEYDYFIAVNSNNAFYMDAFPNTIKKVLLMDDVMFKQFQDTNEPNIVNKYLSSYKNYETDLVNKFDSIIGISKDEIDIFKNEDNKDKFFYLPAFMKSRNIDVKEYKYDVLYIAATNKHNIRACNWFLENVYPLLKDRKLLFVGTICKDIKDKENYKNIEFIDYAENLDDVYNCSKVAICPMLSGTGLKIKVVEALAYAKPIVCNTMGAIGQPDMKNFPALVSDDYKEFANNIIKLLDDNELYRENSKKSLDYFNKYFNYDNNIKVLDEVFK